MLTMKTLFAFAVCSFLLVLSASYGYPQPQAKSENKPTAQDKRGTQESPLIIQGDIITKAPEKPESERKQEEEKIGIERSIATYTGLAAGITFLLVIVTGVLAHYTYKLWKSTNALAEDAKRTADRQASEMRESLEIATRSAKTAEDSVILARNEFNAVHCARLVVRRIIIDGSRELPVIRYEIANIGGTKAKDLEISTMVWLPDTSHSIPHMPQYGDSIALPVTIESGDKYCGECIVAAKEAKEFGFRETQMVGNLPISVILSCIYFLGYIVYRDQLDRRFETAFFRRYDPSSNRFSPVDDPDYEYRA